MRQESTERSRDESGRDFDWSPRLPKGGMATAYLHAGHVFVSGAPCRITTILGSCVAVGIFDTASGVGGLNHFLLPRGPESAAPSPRFGSTAVSFLIEALVASGAHRSRLRAKLFGGACVLQAFRAGGDHLGMKNVAMARAMLAEARIPILAEDVEGERGRKLIFQTHDGSAWVRSL